MLLAPTEPFAAGATMPTLLTMRLAVSVSMDSRLRGTMGLGDSQLSTHRVALTVPLPAPATPDRVQAIFRSLDRSWRSRTQSEDELDDLEAATDQARAGFNGAVIDHRNLDVGHLRRSAYWQEQYLKHASSYSSKQLERYFLARLYHLLGNNARARQLLQETVEDTHFPTSKPSTNAPIGARRMEEENRRIYEENRRSSEEALLTWARD
jgi:hypothetical protein